MNLQICEALLDHCLAPDCRMGGVGCDNMTVILACFLQGGTYTQLAHRCAQTLVPINAHLQGPEYTVSCPPSSNTLVYGQVMEATVSEEGARSEDVGSDDSSSTHIPCTS